jgi:ABC-type transport system, involved in lipoprotein release, permease component
VSGSITTWSGDNITGLAIKEEIYQDMMSAKTIERLKVNLLLSGGIGEFAPEEYLKYLEYSVMAVNDVSAFREDMSANSLFLNSEEAVCIVNEGTMKENGWKIGDNIPLNLYLYYYDPEEESMQLKPLAVSEYKIVDSMKEITSDLMEVADILIPLENARMLYRQENQPFVVNSLSFYVKDPLELNEFKAEMRAFGLLNVNPAGFPDPSYAGKALRVKDFTFISMATQLRQQEGLLQGFFPVIFIIVILVGYITSTLMIQSRRKEFRLMRIIGISKINVIITFFCEQFFLAIFGLLVGVTILWLTKMAQMTALFIAGAICLSYCLGVAVALIRTARNNIMENRI